MQHDPLGAWPRNTGAGDQLDGPCVEDAMPVIWWLALILPVLDPKASVPKTSGRILDCTSHSTWAEPDGWSVGASGDDVVAIAPDRHGILVRTHVTSERGRKVAVTAADARAIAARIAGVELTWTTPTVKKRDKYDHTTIVDTATTGVAVRVVQRDRGYGRDVVWVEVADGPDHAAALATMDAARVGEAMLPDHACVCKTDCDHQP